MRLLFVHQSFPAQYKHIARHYAEQGHEVVALRQALGRDIPGVRSVVYATNTAGAASQDRYTALVEPALRNAQAALEAARSLQAQGFTPDVIVGHNAWGETLFLKDVWPNAPVVSYFEYFYARPGGDSDFDPEFPPGRDSNPHGRIMNAVNLLGLQTTDWGQAPTYWQRSRYPELYHPKISVVHEGIDTDHVKPKPTIQVELPGGRKLTRGDEVITYVSRNLEPYRGFHCFMRTLPLIQKRRPKAHVLMVGGDGVSYGPRLTDGRSFKEALLQEQRGKLDLDRIHFLGQIGYEQFLGVLQVSSVHVYLTYPFVLSWSMLEAMSAGCLVIGSKTPPVEEIITDGVDGLLVDFFDGKGLADRIDAVFAHPDRMQDIRARARATIVERYDLRRVCLPKHLQLIETVAAGGVPSIAPQGVAKMPPTPTDARPLPQVVQPPVLAAPAPATAASRQVTIDEALQLAADAEQKGNVDNASEILASIVQQHPRHDRALYRLGLLRWRQQRPAEAAELIERACAARPGVAVYHCDLGFMYKQLKDFDRRIANYRKAVELDPKNAVAQANLGSALNELGEPEEAEKACRRALEADAKAFGAIVNLGSALMNQNRLAEAERYFRQARNQDPEYGEHGKNLGMCLLLRGNYREGLKFYEERVRSTHDNLARPYTQPRWEGKRFDGKTVFLYSEQGLGDTLNFARYVPLVKARGGRVIVECQEPLLPLIASVAGADAVVVAGREPPAFDLHRSLMSLPHVFGHDLKNIPKRVPYLKVPEPALARWRERLGQPGSGRFKVGVVWAGSPGHGNDKRRSMRLADMAPLFEVPGVDVYSLQKGPAVEQLEPFRDRVTDLGSDFSDFGDTAAVLECLDLLISVDTSVVHLAGALGRPVWMLTAFHPDWRWLLEREDTDWYPTLKLLRQGADKGWGPPVARAAAMLRAEAERASTPYGEVLPAVNRQGGFSMASAASGKES